MALIDYGAVVFKNGICQNSGKFFMDMQESVGWSDASSKSVRDKTDGNFFAYAGDEALTVAVYKHYSEISFESFGELREILASNPDAVKTSDGIYMCIIKHGFYKEGYLYGWRYIYKGTTGMSQVDCWRMQRGGCSGLY